MSGLEAAKCTTVVNAKRPEQEAARLEQLRQKLKSSCMVRDGGSDVSNAEVLAAEAANALQQERALQATGTESNVEQNVLAKED
eukprot:SAG11_NODE_8191_length_1049_cov_0.874737_1_plen_83_part_01